jgi:hypothetical protein
MGKGVVTYQNAEVYDFFNLKKENVSVEIIARSLSKQCRYNGNTHGFYSVAQHSVRMSDAALLVLGDVDIAMQCLFHDAPEVFSSDIVNPIKLLLPPEFKQWEDKMDELVFGYLGIPFPLHPVVKRIDLNICDEEMTIMLNGCVKAVYWPPDAAEELFLLQYEKLKKLGEYKNMELLTEENSHKSRQQ